jgi:hypothetical protein
MGLSSPPGSDSFYDVTDIGLAEKVKSALGFPNPRFAMIEMDIRG